MLTGRIGMAGQLLCTHHKKAMLKLSSTLCKLAGRTSIFVIMLESVHLNEQNQAKSNTSCPVQLLLKDSGTISQRIRKYSRRKAHWRRVSSWIRSHRFKSDRKHQQGIKSLQCGSRTIYSFHSIKTSETTTMKVWSSTQLWIHFVKMRLSQKIYSTKL